MVPAQLQASATELTRTLIAPTLGVPIAEGTNIVWCGTFQLVWGELCKVANGPVHMDNEPPLVEQLNQKKYHQRE